MPDPAQVGATPHRGGRSNLHQRVLSALLFVPGILLLIHWSEWTLLALMLVVSARCTWELCHMATAAGYRPHAPLAISLAAGLMLCAYFAGADRLFLFVLAAVPLVFINALRAGTQRYVANALLVLGGALYTGLLGAAPILLWRQAGGGEEARYLVAAVFFCIWLTDSAAYFCGRQWGRKKLAPSISPAQAMSGCPAEIPCRTARGADQRTVPDSLSRHTRTGDRRRPQKIRSAVVSIQS